MIPRLPLLFVAVTAMGCGTNRLAEVEITDLVMTQTPEGALTSGSFNLHVRVPKESASSDRIRLHALALGSRDVDGTAHALPVTSLAGDAPGVVDPGDESVGAMTFVLEPSASSDGVPLDPCAQIETGFSLGGMYYDDVASGFFKVDSEPAWLPSKRLEGTTWAETFGDASPQLESGAAVLADGSFVLAGVTSGKLDLGGHVLATGGAPTPFLARLDTDGHHVWSRLLPSTHEDPATTRVEGSTLVTAAPDGGIVVAGSFDGTVDLGNEVLTSAGDTDVFVAHLDAAGKVVDAKRFGDALKQTLTTMDVDAAGDVVLVGALSGAMDFGAGAIAPLIDPRFASFYVAKLALDGEPIYAKVPLVLATPGRFSAAVAPGGAVILGGTFAGAAWIGDEPPQDNGPLESGFLEKLAPDGSVAWSAVLPGVGVVHVAFDQDDVVAAVNKGGNGIFVAPGESPGGTFFIDRFDPSGTLRYETPLSTINSVDVKSLVVDSAGHTLLSGMLSRPLALAGSTAAPIGSATSFFAELDRSGVHVRSMAFGCGSFPTDLAVAHAGSRDVLLVSTFMGAVDFGMGVVKAAGATDLLVAKLPAN